MNNLQAITNIFERIAVEAANSGSVRESFDKVMGEGAYDRLAGEVYESLNAK